MSVDYKANETMVIVSVPFPLVLSKQRANLTFADLRTELNKHRVDIFSGLGILDFMGWRPIFVTNFGVYTKYKTESMKWVRQRHPDYNSSMVYKLAEAEWQEGARSVTGLWHKSMADRLIA